jgi:hypothetical protein
MSHLDDQAPGEAECATATCRIVISEHNHVVGPEATDELDELLCRTTAARATDRVKTPVQQRCGVGGTLRENERAFAREVSWQEETLVSPPNRKLAPTFGAEANAHDFG